ncbi:MAG: ABC transporter permease subunit [Melioribacter sp.]|uniref:ABC transporter permease n=1 Tax=Rosettibacter primus TaxID=3111523 RepID=UPI00247B7D16|nr:ABC transporter permease subunit [Melioribacter sp.]
MKTLIYIELLKIFKKWRTYIGFIAIGVLIPIIQLALYFTGNDYLKVITRNLQDSFLMVGNLFNGYLIANLVLSSLFIHIPFLIVLVGGDILAGEATAGTYRILLTRPVSRFQIVSAKYIAGIVYVISLIAWLAFLSLGVSVLIFGTGELISFRGEIIIFASDDVLWRFAYAYSFAILSMITVFSLSFFFSSLVENAIGPIVAAMAVIIVLFVLSALPVDFLNEIQPYFFTTHMSQWEVFFHYQVDYNEIFNSALILGIYSAILFLLTSYIFIKKDILS